MTSPLAGQIADAAGEPASVRIGTVTSVNPLQVDVQGTVYNNLGFVGACPDVGDTVGLLGQSTSAGTDPTSWTVMGKIQQNYLAGQYKKLLGRTERFTSSTANAAAQGVLRLDNIPVPAGHLILCETSDILIFSSIAGDTGSARFSFTTDGTAAGVGSTLATIWNTSAIATAGGGAGAKLSVFLPISAAAYRLSLLLFTVRVTGAGLISLFAAAATHVTQMWIWDCGLPVPDTGVII